jgi:pimeloyl-ACP methyl ester carboxylesterase
MSDTQSATPTVVLVHGALAGTSVWTEVTRRLQGKGVPVLVPALPLRGLASDIAYLAAVLESVRTPVVLVGHSYAGQVISAPLSPAVRALVYVAAFQPDTGETAGELNARFPGSLLGPDTIDVLPCPGGNDLYLRQEHFREVYAGDVAADTAAVMAASQRPIDPAAMDEPLTGPAAWRSLPSWSLVSTQDNSIPAQALRFMADRAGSHTVQVPSSHAVPVSHPDVVTDLVLDAVAATTDRSTSA